MNKRFLQRILRHFGYYLRSTRHFGDDQWKDIATLLRPDPTRASIYFDVGAHHGETIAAMRLISPTAVIHAFEPDPESFGILSNAKTQSQGIHLHACALGHEPGTAAFRRNKESMTNSLLPTSQESLSGKDSNLTQTTEEIVVPVNTITAFCQRENIQTIDLLKTDCQGFDLKVLQGAEEMLRNQQIGLVTSEMIFDDEYDGQGHAHDILGFMFRSGYRLIGFYNMARNDRHECTFCDAIFAPHRVI